MKSRLRLAIVLALALPIWLLSPVVAATTSSTFYLSQISDYEESTLTFRGLIKPKVKNAVVSIYVKQIGRAHV